jgi:hypothetical protein
MAGGGLPPPPTRAGAGDFAWTAWYNQLYTLLNTNGSVSWDLINKAGSSIADLQNKNHNLLTGKQGGTTNEFYHLTAAQAALVALLPNISGNAATATNVPYSGLTGAVPTWNQDTTGSSNLLAVQSKSSDPTTSDIAASKAAVYKNTTTGLVKLWANDGGTMKSVLLT